MTATAPPTDWQAHDFLEGAQFAGCSIIAEQWTSDKRKKERLTDEAPISCFVCKPSLYIL